LAGARAAELEDVAEGREEELLSLLELPGVKASPVFVYDRGEGEIIRRVSLDNGSASAVAAADAADDLAEELVGAFLGGVIREIEAGIGGHDADEGQAWQV